MQKQRKGAEIYFNSQCPRFSVYNGMGGRAGWLSSWKQEDVTEGVPVGVDCRPRYRHGGTGPRTSITLKIPPQMT